MRELVGYLRFDTEEELDLLNRIWALDHHFTKRHDTAQTPFARALADDRVTSTARSSLTAAHKAIWPDDLYRQINGLINGLIEQLERLALQKAPAPLKPPVNYSFIQSRQPEVLGEAMNRASRRI